MLSTCLDHSLWETSHPLEIKEHLPTFILLVLIPFFSMENFEESRKPYTNVSNLLHFKAQDDWECS